MVNLIKNGNFSLGSTANWEFYTNGTGTFTVVSGRGKVVLTNRGSNNQLFQRGFTLKPNTQYKLTLKASASQGSDIQINIIRDTSPYTNYGLAHVLNLTSTLTSYEKTFTTSGFSSTVSNARFQFYFNAILNNEIILIDDVVLEEVINAVPVLTTIAVAGCTSDLAIGNTCTITATCKDQNGAAMTCPVLRWTSSDTSKAVVDSGGIVAGIATGTAIITATGSGTTVSGFKTVTVSGSATVHKWKCNGINCVQDDANGIYLNASCDDKCTTTTSTTSSSDNFIKYLLLTFGLGFVYFKFVKR